MQKVNKSQRQIIRATFRMALFDSIVAINPEVFSINDSKEQELEAAISKEADKEIRKYKNDDLANLYAMIVGGGRVEYDYNAEAFSTILNSDVQEEEEVSYGVADYNQTNSFEF